MAKISLRRRKETLENFLNWNWIIFKCDEIRKNKKKVLKISQVHEIILRKSHSSFNHTLFWNDKQHGNIGITVAQHWHQATATWNRIFFVAIRLCCTDRLRNCLVVQLWRRAAKSDNYLKKPLEVRKPLEFTSFLSPEAFFTFLMAI